MWLGSGVAVAVAVAVATAPIGPLAWAPRYAAGALKRQKKKKKEFVGKIKGKCSYLELVITVIMTDEYDLY